MLLFSEVWRSVLPQLPVGFIRTACRMDKWLQKPPPQHAFLKMAIWHWFSRQAMMDQLCRGETGGRVWTSPALIIHLLHDYFWHFLCEQPIATLEMSSKRDCLKICASVAMFFSFRDAFNPRVQQLGTTINTSDFQCGGTRSRKIEACLSKAWLGLLFSCIGSIILYIYFNSTWLNYSCSSSTTQAWWHHSYSSQHSISVWEALPTKQLAKCLHLRGNWDL